ncbi:MAG: FKBP-type peptidyl-prolyl cis-trans isomerase [Muribaculaceae bacterium]|nr:FKBP-type peptidyl-prolyl cis-trans isomerase [Muribaculaceae bacterium]
MKKIILVAFTAFLGLCVTSCNGGNTDANGAQTADTTVYQSDINEANGKAFIEKKLKEDSSYIKTESGLVYKVLAEGKGECFTQNDVIMTKYEGKHIDGKVFDNGNGEAVPFSCGSVIRGFGEVLQLMKPGMKVEVLIPSELGYGAQGVKDPNTGEEVIGANETLVFVLETIEKQQTLHQ